MNCSFLQLHCRQKHPPKLHRLNSFYSCFCCQHIATHSDGLPKTKSITNHCTATMGAETTPIFKAKVSCQMLQVSHNQDRKSLWFTSNQFDCTSQSTSCFS